MLRIKARPAPSRTHGLGLFAVEDIYAGQVIWEFHPFFDQVMSKRKFISLCRGLDDKALEHVLSCTYKRKNRFYYLTDNARFINHDEHNANVVILDDHTEVALRDIRAGEELLENYFESYDADDFFTFELRNISMQDYLESCQPARRPHADSQHLSGQV